MFKILKIRGESLTPEYNQGDYILVITHSHTIARLKPGDVIVFQHPVYGTMVKRVEQIDPQAQEIFVVGTHPQSLDSRQFGPIPRHWVTGKAIWHIANRDGSNRAS
ncbi:MAG TPA: hypothetical protein DEH25_16155 [Chloroflexi bacterium]|nr:hypothetical protein [Chloroflexota bacterium]HBY06995.1 hypothetical protein [Chloroflexota bacterium]